MCRPAAAEDPDQLYADRRTLASAVRAAELWTAELDTNPRSFESAWKLARVCYWLGGHAAATDRRPWLERGIDAGRRASGLEPERPEGHFWIAANMGALAESAGLRAGIRDRGPIREELEIVRRLAPEFMSGSADRALGRWYFKVPRLFGGSNKRAEEHLRASLTYWPASTVSRFFLAEVLLDENRRDEARRELQQVLDAPFDPDWAPEDDDYKERARALLRSVDAGK